MSKTKLPLRIGVGIIVLNSKNLVFVGKRKDNPIDKWQMPQGGVDNNEDLVTAMRESCLKRQVLKILKFSKKLVNGLNTNFLKN